MKKPAFISRLLNSEVSDSNFQDHEESSYAESQPSTRDGETARATSTKISNNPKRQR